MDSCKNLLIPSPLELSDWSTLSLDSWHSFPALIVCWTFSGELLALPHYDKASLSTARYDPSLGIIFDGYDLIVDHLTLERGLSQCQNVVLIIFNVKHSYHVLS